MSASNWRETRLVEVLELLRKHNDSKKATESIAKKLEKQNESCQICHEKIGNWLNQKSKSKIPYVVLKSGKNVKISGWSNSASVRELNNALASIDLPKHPALHNLVFRRDIAQRKLKQLEVELKKVIKSSLHFGERLEDERIRLETAIERAKQLEVSYSTSALSKGSKPPRMGIENWEDAEVFAVKYMRWLGFTDAKKTRGGTDEGKDVDSSKAVAQVKDMGTGVSRPMLQQLFGVAAAEKKVPVFFARSYAKTAKEWGEKYKVALFQYTLKGEVKPMSKKAQELLAKRK